MDIKIYGIKNCNSMKKAFSALEDKGLEYEFIDYKKTPPSPAFLESLLGMHGAQGLESLINTRGTTYRRLKQSGAIDGLGYDLVQNNPSLLKRPLVLVTINGETRLLVGLEALLASLDSMHG